MKQDYARLLDDLRANPTMGTDLGHHLRKVRMAIASKGKGKRGEGDHVHGDLGASGDGDQVNHHL